MAIWFRRYKDKVWLRAHHFTKGDITLQISAVSEHEFTKDDGTKEWRLVLHFARFPYAWGMPESAGKVIAKLYGADDDAWVGKWITLFADTGRWFGRTQTRVFVRPIVPKRSAAAAADQAPELLAAPPAPPPAEPTGGES